MTPQELEDVRRVIQEVTAPHPHKKRCIKRRFIIVAAAGLIPAAIMYWLKLEISHEAFLVSVDALAACTADKVIFGIAEL